MGRHFRPSRRRRPRLVVPRPVAASDVCINAYIVDIGKLVSNARLSAGCTIRSLGADAEVAGSTITRIQSGTVDPSVKTLARILDAAGFTLVINAVRHGAPPRPHLTDLIGAWSYHRGRLRLDWTRWRASSIGWRYSPNSCRKRSISLRRGVVTQLSTHFSPL